MYDRCPNCTPRLAELAYEAMKKGINPVVVMYTPGVEHETRERKPADPCQSCGGQMFERVCLGCGWTPPVMYQEPLNADAFVVAPYVPEEQE